MNLLRMYADCLGRVPRDLARSPWVLLLPMGYMVVLMIVTTLVAPMGIVGGFIMGLVEAALMASFLYIVDELVSRNPVRPDELVTSVSRYMWPVVNVLFVFWIKDLLLNPLLGQMANGAAISIALTVVLFILLNATPEVIYQRRLYGGLDILSSAVAFIQEHWIEWFIPNIAIGAAAYFLWPRLSLFILIAFPSILGQVVLGLVGGALVLPIFIFRGHLFREIDSGGARARRFRYGR